MPALHLGVDLADVMRREARQALLAPARRREHAGAHDRRFD